MSTRTTIPAPDVNSQAYARVFDKMYITNVEKRLVHPRIALASLYS